MAEERALAQGHPATAEINHAVGRKEVATVKKATGQGSPWCPRGKVRHHGVQGCQPK